MKTTSRKAAKPQKETKWEDRKTKLSECEIGDIVRVGDDPFDAELRSHIHIQVPAPMPHRTLDDELARGMNVECVPFPPPFLFEREPWSTDGKDQFYVWRRIA